MNFVVSDIDRNGKNITVCGITEPATPDENRTPTFLVRLLYHLRKNSSLMGTHRTVADVRISLIIHFVPHRIA